MKWWLPFALCAACCLGQTNQPAPVTNTLYFTCFYTNGSTKSPLGNVVPVTNPPDQIAWSWTYALQVHSGGFVLVWGSSSNEQNVIGSQSSGLSNAVVWPPPMPSNRVVQIQPIVATNLNGPWVPVPNWPAITKTNPSGMMFYRYAITSWTQ